MEKALKIIGIIVLVLIVGIIILLKFLESRPAVPANYTQDTETGGSIEAKYMATGGHEVSTYEEPALQGFSKYTIYYPTELETADEKYPVIVVCNGSGTPISKYLSIPEHFASWGFIVIGTEEEYDWSGFSAVEWEYDATLVDIPILLIAGAGAGDDWVITGEQLQNIYSDIDSNKVMLRRKDTSHNETLYAANGYVAAWFMWHLQGDDEAAKAFAGSNAEIYVNSLYQDQHTNLQ